MFKRFLSWLLGTSAALPAPVEVPAAPAPMRISDGAYAQACAAYGEPLNPWTVPERPPFVPATVAMDAAPGGSLTELYNWATKGAFSEGLGFLGYPYLAELSQRPEYRRVSEIIAAEATRKWVKISGPDEDRVNAIEAAMKRFDIISRFREAAEQDGFFGRSQIFVDLGHPLNAKELSKPLPIRKEKIGKGKVVNFKVVEPFWSYPGTYDSMNPLAADYYRPKYWYVMSAQVHSDRLLTFVGREMPDMLKPSYMFGGLSLSQMCKPYVDNWLRTRQSVSDLVHSFSTMVLATDMSTLLSGGSADSVVRRAEVYKKTRDNRGLLMINKDAEELTNVSTPLGTLDKLQAQSQEQIASVSGIPLVVLLGVTPSGLNASSDGEIKTFYATIKAYQERVMRGPLQTVLEIIQLDLDGNIDEEITFEFVDLWELDESAKAAIRKTDADIDMGYVNGGVVSPEEVRDRVANDEGSPYFGVDLSSAPPEPPEDDSGDDDSDKPAQDEWDESKVKRADNGQFGSGGGGASPAATRKDAEASRARAIASASTALPRPGALPSAGTVRQPYKSWEEAQAMGEAGLAEYRKILTRVGKQMGLDMNPPKPDELPADYKGGALFIGKLKSEERAREKVTKDYKGDWSQLKDMVRATISVETIEELGRAVEDAKAAGLEFSADPKNSYARPTPSGYRDFNTLVTLPNGMMAELQFNVTPMLVAKAAAHGHYEAERKLIADHTSEGSDVPAPFEEWSADDRAAYENAVKIQKEIYGAAWEKMT